MRKVLAVSFMLFVTSVPISAAGQYKYVKEIPMGGEGGWGYLLDDAHARDRYIGDADRVVDADSHRDTIAGEIADAPGVHGVAIARELGRGVSFVGEES